jgi:hypothetical protein
MLRKLRMCAVAIALATVPAVAQPTTWPIDAEAALASIGLPIFSSDGEQMGRVAGISTRDREIVLIAEMGLPLAIGSLVVAVPTDMVVRVTDRVELNATAEEIRRQMADLAEPQDPISSSK